MRRVLRWDVPIDDKPHKIGGGKVVHVDCRDDRREGPTRRVEVWTEEQIPADMPMGEFDGLLTREVIVVGTAHPIPERFEQHIGSAIEPDAVYRLVWHVYAKVPF